MRLAAWLVAVIVGAVVLAPPATAVPLGCDPAFEVVDHRGAHGQQDENTLSAILVAAERGESVEIDARATLDGRLILMHDATFDRTTNGSGRVADATFAVARTYRTVPRGEQIPTLSEALKATASYDVDVYVDVKGGDKETLTTAAKVFRGNDALDRTLVTSWTTKMGRVAPDIPRQWKPDGQAPTVADVVALGVQSVGLFQHQMSHELVDGVRAAGIEVHSRLVSSVSDWDAVTEYGIQGALTNTPVALTRYCSGS